MKGIIKKVGGIEKLIEKMGKMGIYRGIKKWL